jgi:transcriptional regulator GlxA family with amidase domain
MLILVSSNFVIATCSMARTDVRPQVKEQNGKVEWVPVARWVVDGNIWTSSGIAAGIDMIYAWIGEVWGEETASLLADSSEYSRNRDPGNDVFAKRWGSI